MSKRPSRRAILISAVAVLLIALVTVWVIKIAQPEEAGVNPGADSSASQPASDSSEGSDGSDKSAAKPEDGDSNDDAGEKSADSDAQSIDPASVDSLDIEPLGVTVSYVKGVGGFEYEVLRTPSGTRYANFKNEGLVGTKCTDDKGVFASILVSPKEDEQATLAKKLSVDGVTYGLSLASAACTSNTDLLESYQQSFADAFGLIKKIDG